MKTRIAVYGGTNLSPEHQEFVRFLVEALLANPDVSILSGGFFRDTRRPNDTSVDKCVLQTVESKLTVVEMAARLETWLPSPALDRPTVERFRRGTVHELHGTSQARRFKLVQEAAALLTVVGKEHTRSLLELSLALERPALPIPFTGGDSQTIWKRNRNDLLASLRLSPAFAIQLEQTPTTTAQRRAFAKYAVKLLYAAAQRRCLVLMPFGGSHDSFYDEHLRPAIQRANFIAHRIDKDDYAGDIPTLFRDAVASSSATVIDLSGMNPNVLYELGYLHSRGVTPLLVRRCQSSNRDESGVPFYLLHQKMITASDSESGRKEIAAHVEQFLQSVTRRTASRRDSGDA